MEIQNDFYELTEKHNNREMLGINQNMKASTIQKCQEAVTLVYVRGYTLRGAAKTVGISSQTIYAYRDDHLSKNEKLLLNGFSKRNRHK